MSKAHLKALTVLLRSSQTVEETLRKDIQTKYAMNMTEFAVMELLFHKGDQPIQRIGEKILITSGSITYVVDKLEKKGFVKRVACPSDRRVTFATLSEDGQQLMQNIFPKHEEKVSEVFDVLEDEEVTQLTNILKKLGFYARDLKQ